MALLTKTATNLAESGLLPDAIVRAGIRQLVEERRRQIGSNGESVNMDAFVAMMDRSDIALVPNLANKQHYEVPAGFFVEVLGSQCKYSCCYWGDGAGTLDEAEEAALEITARRARLADGQRILDLGCGWGSFSLWAAARYPAASVTAVSNSAPQRAFIERRAAVLGLENLRVITADMNHFHCDESFDRIVSIEMFEHMRNYRALFARIANWLEDDGCFFMHIFCNRDAAYEYVDQGPADWMSRHFFSGGIMPSEDLPFRFHKHLVVKEQWRWSGDEYRRTALAWLANMDANRASILKLFDGVYGSRNSRRWFHRWRMFFLAVAEMFGYEDGAQWRVGHYLLEKTGRDAAA